MATFFHTIFDPATSSTWVADGDFPVARLDLPRLRDLTLRPGTSLKATWLTLFWWQYAGNEKPGRSAWILDEAVIDDRNPNQFRLLVRSHNQGRLVESACQLALSLDNTLGSYVYDVQTELTVQPGKNWRVEPQGGVEFTNPWFRDAVGPALPGTDLPPAWPWVLYTNPQGGLSRLPLNHMGSPALERITFPETGGWLGFFQPTEGSPVIELDGPTARSTRVEVCAWGYDAHFIHRVPPLERWPVEPFDLEQAYEPVILESGQRLNAHYRLYSLSPSEASQLVQQSTQIHLPSNLVHRLTRPALELPRSTFAPTVSPERPDSSWYWSPSHAEGVTWEQGSGRSDSHSLHIHNTLSRTAYWEAPLGPDFWQAALPTDPQTIRLWVRTRQVVGSGAQIMFRYSSYAIETGQAARLLEYRSAALSGDQDWTCLELTVPPAPAGATRAYLRLLLDGAGEAWFDDLRLEAAGEPEQPADP